MSLKVFRSHPYPVKCEQVTFDNHVLLSSRFPKAVDELSDFQQHHIPSSFISKYTSTSPEFRILPMQAASSPQVLTMLNAVAAMGGEAIHC